MFGFGKKEEPKPGAANEKMLKKVVKGNYKINSDGTIDADAVEIEGLGVVSIFNEIGQFNKIKQHFKCGYNKLTSLKGCPEEVGADFDCSGNQLISLEDSPTKVGGSYNCSSNKIKSLKGSPAEIKMMFAFMNNQVSDLAGHPKKANTVMCSGNPGKFTEEQIRAVCTVGSKVKTESKIHEESESQFIENVLGTRVLCYDSGPKTLDRYTILFLDYERERDGSYYALGSSENPFHSYGFGQHVSAKMGRHLGKPIKFRNLPPDVQKFVKQDIE